MTDKSVCKIDEFGNKFWWLGKKRHREDGPAVEHTDGSKMWFINDKYHRVDGPALEEDDGSRYWMQNGKYHREDGPAITFPDNDKESPYWYINGRRLYPEKTIKNKKLQAKYPRLIESMIIHLVHNS